MHLDSAVRYTIMIGEEEGCSPAGFVFSANPVGIE